MAATTSPFQRALDEYLLNLPSHKKKSKFLLACYNSQSPVSPEALNDAIIIAEERASKTTSRKIIKKILQPVVAALKDYFCVVDSLVNYSLPAAIVWGAVRVILEGIDRCVTLFDKIKNQLRALTVILQRISEYEDVYRDSSTLQDLLCKTYVEIFRFWSRVDRECDQYGIKSLLRVAVSFTTNKLDESIQDIQSNVEAIEKLAPIVDARRARGEQEDARHERIEAGLERLEAGIERHAQQEFREMYQDDRHNERYYNLVNWLDSRESIEANDSRHAMNLRSHFSGTCMWFMDNDDYISWEQGVKSPSILWCHAPPGTGKSILCSQVVRKLTAQPSVAVAYLFYQFDRPYTAVETLRLIAAQLITSSYLTYKHVISDDLYMKSRGARTFDNLSSFVKVLVQQFGTVCLLFDGLDEECVKDRWPEACTVLDFLVELATAHPSIVRLWFSSQDRPSIRTKMEAYTICNFHEYMKADVGIFLSNLNTELQDFVATEEERSFLLNKIQQRGESNFLWVTLMVNTLREEASSPMEVKMLVEDGLPMTLDEYYRRIFGRFEQHDRALVCKIFSLIAFARRPLRMSELREGLGILSIHQSTSSSLDPRNRPNEPYLRKLFAPLIQVNPVPDSDDCVCRLFHSTVKDFLRKSGGKVFGDSSSELTVSPRFSARACLAYLRQPRYAAPLYRHEEGHWVDSGGSPVKDHLFLLYAAKYWDKHFDEVQGDDEAREQITAFITSHNFQTFIQIQSLWLENRFGIFQWSNQCECEFCVRLWFLVRVFPAWLINGPGFTNERRLWASYRRLIHDWRHFLACTNCDDPKCLFVRCSGEIDRCWFGALGSRNFLSGLKGRYRSFCFEREGSVIAEPGPSFEGITPTGDKMKVLRLNVIDVTGGKLTFTCEHWSIQSSSATSPALENTQIITVHETTSCWPIYGTTLTESAQQKRIGRALLAVFSSDCQYLRIGTQLFALKDDMVYQPLFKDHDASTSSQYPTYVEEFVIRGSYAVLATRRRVKQEDIRKSGITDETVTGFGVDFNSLEEANLLEDDDCSVSSIETQSLDSSGSSEFESDSENDAYESWSEGETDLDGEDFEEDKITPWAGAVDDLYESDSSSELESSDSEESDADKKDVAAEDGTSDDDINLDPDDVIGYGRWYDEEAGEEENEEEYAYYAYGPPLPHKTAPDLRASISVFLIGSSSSQSRRIFHFSQELPITLYNSPPAIHPSKSLVVWPVGRGDVLFADFLCQSYFIRKLRLSTPYSAHISVQCKFSDCGRHLFIASFEGQRKPNVKEKQNSKGFNMALLVLTYRLSQSRTTRSPPRLIHRTRVNLSQKNSISVTNFPFTLSWTPRHVYLTCSDNTLKVFRIDLFSLSGRSSVSVPQKLVILPGTASRRKVHYFPPVSQDSEATIFIKSEARVKGDYNVTSDLDVEYKHNRGGGVFGMEGAPVPISPPVGCFIDEEKDLGGWGPWKELTEVPDDLGIGHLDRRLEKFDFDDDCDLEPYIF